MGFLFLFIEKPIQHQYVVTEETTVIREERHKQPPLAKPHPPTILTPLLNREIDDGQSLTLSVLVDAQPPASITWFVNGVELKEDHNTRIIHETNKSTVILTKAKIGDYVAVAVNPAGQAVSQATMEGKGEKMQSITPYITIWRNYMYLRETSGNNPELLRTKRYHH